MDSKICRHCGKDKPVLEFESRRDVKGGRSHKCYECVRNKVHVYKTPEQQLLRQRKPRSSEPKVIQYFEHDPYYKF